MAKAIIQQQVDRLIYAMIGTILTMPVQQVPETCMICDGSLVLFEDWPEFKDVYDAGKFTGMVLDAADSAQVGKFVKNGSSGVYLPDLEGLYEQASSAANAGGYLAAGLPNIKGFINIEGANGAGFYAASYGGALAPSTTQSPNSQLTNAAGGPTYTGIILSAGGSNPIYSDSVDTVQPPSVRYVRAMYLGKPSAA